MGWWEISADTLAGSRFVISPLAEAIAGLKTLQRGTAAHPGERAWLDTHLPAYRERLAGDPLTALLVRAALGHRWNATFLTPTPTGDGQASEAAETPSLDQELARLRETPPATARADLTVSLGGRPLPGPLRRADDLPGRTADLLEWVWRAAVLPYWPQRRRIIEADVLARTAQLSRGGWAAALADMRPGMRWLGANRLQITTYDHPPRELSGAGAQLLFVPVTPHQTWLSWDVHPPRCGGVAGRRPGERRSAVVYPCSGALAEAGRAPVPGALGALLGPARACVLVLLGSPKSTTQLVALTGQGLGSVGRHLKVLLDARLIGRRRTGRSVLYYRTAAGEVLVAAQTGG
ncbi:ArsR family transcriptional regulator [Streptomyces inhibens]|uniref:ArsR family transcriptional regulator n=1 Tax=Streptomyces inhibens TaxID=2293571 RepID=A0A371Q2Q1_STRIH|nr:winged helix-turn-helix domain-containing protein [Streptomyces inhibens]REK89025.1 ArsR family transcriptional regulator [Streptomyces inhibens]